MEIWSIFILVGLILFGTTFGKLPLERATTSITNTFYDESSENVSQAHHHSLYTGIHNDDLEYDGLSNLTTHESEIIESDRQGRCE